MNLDRETELYTQGCKRGLEWAIERVTLIQEHGDHRQHLYPYDGGVVVVLNELKKMMENVHG